MPDVIVRNTQPEDFPGIRDLSARVYPHEPPWTAPYLASQCKVFPEGQFVAIDTEDDAVVGMAASLIVNWDDYDHLDSYLDMTDHGWFTNHDPDGRTLYGAEVMVDPTRRRRGIGAKIYAARRDLAQGLGLLRIRAGARLPGYRKHADRMTADEYVRAVVRGELHDSTLSFQLGHGFQVIALVPDYHSDDKQSRGYAALIEWINPQVATPWDYARRNTRYLRPE